MDLCSAASFPIGLQSWQAVRDHCAWRRAWNGLGGMDRIRDRGKQCLRRASTDLWSGCYRSWKGTSGNSWESLEVFGRVQKNKLFNMGCSNPSHCGSTYGVFTVVCDPEVRWEVWWSEGGRLWSHFWMLYLPGNGVDETTSVKLFDCDSWQFSKIFCWCFILLGDWNKKEYTLYRDAWVVMLSP